MSERDVVADFVLNCVPTLRCIQTSKQAEQAKPYTRERNAGYKCLALWLTSSRHFLLGMGFSREPQAPYSATVLPPFAVPQIKKKTAGDRIQCSLYS